MAARVQEVPCRAFSQKKYLSAGAPPHATPSFWRPFLFTVQSRPQLASCFSFSRINPQTSSPEETCRSLIRVLHSFHSFRNIPTGHLTTKYAFNLEIPSPQLIPPPTKSIRIAQRSAKP